MPDQKVLAATAATAEQVSMDRWAYLERPVDLVDLVDRRYPAEQLVTAVTVGLAAPGTPDPTLRQALPRKAARPVVPAVPADQVGQLVAL